MPQQMCASIAARRRPAQLHGPVTLPTDGSRGSRHAELITFRIGHDDVVPLVHLQHDRPERAKAPHFLGDTGPLLVRRSLAGHAQVHMQAIFAVLGSGTLSRLRRGATPEGSCSHAPLLASSSSSSYCANHSSRLLNGAGGGSSTYPAAAFQNSARTAAFEQSNVRSMRANMTRTLPTGADKDNLCDRPPCCSSMSSMQTPECLGTNTFRRGAGHSWDPRRRIVNCGGPFDGGEPPECWIEREFERR